VEVCPVVDGSSKEVINGPHDIGPIPDIGKIEKKVREIWESNAVFVYRNGKGPLYVIDTPPPTTSGILHCGHVMHYVEFDIMARFKRMQGYRVLFPIGFDCDGLPIEVKAEQLYNVTKSDVPREKFKAMCWNIVNKWVRRQTEQLKALGMSVDWTTKYLTMMDDYIRKTQIAFVTLYKKGLIYRAAHPIFWCPRCQTALAKEEIEYKIKKGKMVYIKFKIMDSDESVIVATTRPELLPAIQAILVHPNDERYTSIVGKEVLVPIFAKRVQIISDDEVDPSFGTGAVMVCTFGDIQDVKWMYKHKLLITKAIDETGRMTNVCGDYAGLHVEEARDKIINDLRAQGHLAREEEIEHEIGICWRCDTPVELIVSEQWFIKMTHIKDKLLKAADNMKWVPDYYKTRYKNWVRELLWDWCISRQRIFGVPIPAWICDRCGKEVVAEIEQLPCDPVKDKPPVERCPYCGGRLKGCTDILDTWVSSSLTPLYITGWPNPSYKEKFPVSLRPQAHDNIHRWHFYSILMSLLLTGRLPYHLTMISGHGLDPKGVKMSKSKGNVIIPDEVIEKYGADALRVWAASVTVGDDARFDWSMVRFGRRFVVKLWNIARFCSTFMMPPSNIDIDEIVSNPIDRWILTKLSILITEVTDHMENFRFNKALFSIYEFIWHDVADDYLEMVKYRLYEGSNKTDVSAQVTLYVVLLNAIKLLSPIMPFITEEIYQRLFRKYEGDVSISVSKWPSKVLIDEDALKEGELVRQVISSIRREKARRGIPLGEEVAELHLYTINDDIASTLKKNVECIAKTLKFAKVDIKKVNALPEPTLKILKDISFSF